MSTNIQIRRAVRCALLAGAVVAAVSPAQAQDPAIQEVVVTGSRISSGSIDSPSPVQIIGAEDIDATGAPNMQDILLKNPTLGTPGISRTNSNFSDVGRRRRDGRPAQSRHCDRTLTLVDGRRFVVRSCPARRPSIYNTIPAQFIERVEVLTGGASAVYGSDAVAGVVNIIYQARTSKAWPSTAQYGSSAESDNEETQIGLTFGTSTEDGRGNIMAHVGVHQAGRRVLARPRRARPSTSSRPALAHGRSG